MRRGRGAVALALLISLGLHAVLLVGLRGLPLPERDPSAAQVVDARLLIVPPPAPRPEPAPNPVRPKPAPPPEPAIAPPEQIVAASTPADTAAEIAATAAEAALSVPQPQRVAGAVPSDLPMPSPEAAPAPPLNALPARIDMRFSVHYGLAAGEQTLIWVNEGGRYTLTSVAAATGLTGVLYRGRFVQTSRGRITPLGLQPEEFWDQRGDKRASARLDAANEQVSLTTARGDVRHFPYQAGMQDALSLFLQLALTAPPPDGVLRFAVFNGKKVRDYVFSVRGEIELETALGLLRTLHLVRVGNPDERFEAWLAIDRHYLPVRVLKSDDKGNAMELRIKSMVP